MKVVILGSGIIGTTSAYYLARQGHEVTVLDRQPGPGLETSNANAGQVSPGYSAPWAAPGIPLKAIKWLLSEHSPLVIRPTLDPAMWRWAFSMLRNCTSARYAINKGRMLRLAEYSRRAFGELRADTNIHYDERTQGTLQLFRTQKQLDDAHKDTAVLSSYGVPFELLDAQGCVAAEPGLAGVREKIIGGLRLPLDETGDCFMFTESLAEQAAALGVEFRYGTDIQGLQSAGDKIAGVITSTGSVTGDSYVMAMGSYSTQMLKQVGIDIPVYPVKGYSITLPIEDENCAPVSTIMDETYKVAVTRLGDRIRAAGTAELGGFDLTLREASRRTVSHVVSDLFPTGGNVDGAEFWCGLRPMTPDGTPLVGATKLSNLFLNTGHGTLGWTMSCGSGRLLADIISERQPEIDLGGLSIERYAASGPAARDKQSAPVLAVSG
jgi:D-amino-acid dehydrogenase